MDRDPDPTHAIPSAAQILRMRARALARIPASETAAGETLEVLEFRLANEHYALESRHVREVHPLRSLTPVPCTPAFVRGIVNVRGRVVPVLDLKRLFGLPDEGLTDLHRIILIGNDDLEFGLLADASVGIRTIPLHSIQPAQPAFEAIDAAYLRGVTAEHLMVLDAAVLMADPRIVVDEQP
jgi:purine-binding chemotaxis protein CheW